jgi:hypothetical protein
MGVTPPLFFENNKKATVSQKNVLSLFLLGSGLYHSTSKTCPAL